MLFRMISSTIVLLSLAIWAVAAAPPVPAKDLERVQTIISAINMADPATLDAAEEALVQEGGPLLPAVRAVLDEKIADLSNVKKPVDIPQTNAQIDVLDRAIIRLTWKINPPQLIQQWADARVKKADGAFILPRPQRIMDARVAKTFPNDLIYIIRFRQYPVARMLPEPLSANNIFLVSRDGKVQHLTDAKGLQDFFKASLAPVKEEKVAREVMYSWLRLAEELVQDGMFQFSIPEDAITATKTREGIVATGKAVVNPVGGNSGELCATLTFAGGKLTGVNQSSNIRAGIRPICQATKLLDPDPIVRKMAEQDLLIMGPAAESYIMEQRAKAGPELQAAIDSMWARILARWKE